MHSSCILHAFVHPFEERLVAFSAPLSLGVLLLPDGFKVKGLNAEALERERKVDLGRDRGVVLLDARADTPVFSHCRFSVAASALLEIIQRRIHIHALNDGVAD